MATLHEQILEQVEAYVAEAETFDGKGVKAAAARARKALGEIGKLAKARRAEIQDKKNNMQGQMAKQKDDVIKMMGEVVDVLPGTMFKVKLDDVDKEIICYLSGKMRQFKIKVLLGDKVEIEMSPYDMEKGRITHRHK